MFVLFWGWVRRGLDWLIVLSLLVGLVCIWFGLVFLTCWFVLYCCDCLVLFGLLVFVFVLDCLLVSVVVYVSACGS